VNSQATFIELQWYVHPPFGGVDNGTPSNGALQRQLLYR
jgi:hypothetical protein